MTQDTSHGDHVLVAGASGVIGAPAVERFSRLAGWTVTALSRRRPFVSEGTSFEHASVDLRDGDACARLAGDLAPVTHLVYAAVSEAPGLVSGWQDEALMQENGRMLRNLLDPLARTGTLRHVSILQGAKAYGGHLHPVTVPQRESQPRDDHRNFYWLHEDCTRELAARHGFTFTIWRPQILLGSAPGAAMNPVAAIGAYAALCGELGQPFVLPGTSERLWEMVDADLMADALAWSATAKEAANETFNITNGDVFVLRHAWPALAASLGLETGEEAPETITAFFATEESSQAWKRIASRERLAIDDLHALLGQSHSYLEMLTSSRIAAKPHVNLLSTIKLRQAGFGACCDSEVSLRRQLTRMADLRLLPPQCRPA